MRFSFFLLFLSLNCPPGQCASPAQELLRLPEEKIDVGIAALTLAKEIFPEIDVASYSRRIDDLAEQVRRLAAGTRSPDQRVRCLNTVLYLTEEFRANRDISFPRQSKDYFLNRILDTKRGNCFTMPLLYIAVSQRLGWPVYLVHVPDHSFVRYLDPAFNEQNIEATSGGGYVPDEQYARLFLVSAKGRAKGAYLRTLTRRELLGDLLEATAVVLGQNGQLLKAIAYLRLATRANPRLVTAWVNLVNAYLLMERRSTGKAARNYHRLAEKYSKKVDEFGFVHPKAVPQFTTTRRPK